MQKLKDTINKDLYKELSLVGLIFLLLGILLFIGIVYNTLTLVFFGATLFISIVPLLDRYKYIKYCLELKSALNKSNPELFFRNHLVDQHMMFRNTDHNVVSSNTTSNRVREIGLIEKLNKVLDEHPKDAHFEESDPFFEYYYKNKTTS